MIHIYFIKCSEYASGSKRIKMQKLALGIGGLIINRNNNYYLVTHSGEFKIPTDYTQDSYLKLTEMLWPTNPDVESLKNIISASNKDWTNLKKKEKIIDIDNQLDTHIADVFAIKALISLLIYLKIIGVTEMPNCYNYLKLTEMLWPTNPDKLTN